jgi:hypothetical protein
LGWSGDDIRNLIVSRYTLKLLRFTYPDEDKGTCGVDTTETEDDEDVLNNVVGRGDTDDETSTSCQGETTDERWFIPEVI